MRLHEEFKLYEELWEETEESTLEASGTTDSYIKKMGSQEYDLLDKYYFKEYAQRKFYMRTDGNGKGRYYGAYIFPMDYFISQFELAIKKIMSSLGADKKKGLLDDAMLAKIKGYADDMVQEYKRLRDSSKFMICYEKDGRFKPGILPDYRYTLKFYDIGDPDVAYKFIQTYGGAETVCRLLRQYNQKETLDKLAAMTNKTIWGDTPTKSKYYHDNSKYKNNITSTTTSHSNNSTDNSTDNPDKYIEYDSFFEEFN